MSDATAAPKEQTDRTARKVYDPELQAMAECLEAVKDLDDEAAWRVVSWLYQRQMQQTMPVSVRHVLGRPDPQENGGP